MSVVQVLFKKGVLFDLDIGKWHAISRMNEDDLLLKNVNRKAVYLGHKKLLPYWASQKLSNLEGKLRGALGAHSSPFPIAGAVFVQYKYLGDLMKKLKALKAEYEVAADELVASYDNYKNYQIQTLDQEAENIAKQHYGDLEAQAVKEGGWSPELKTEYHNLVTWLDSQKAQHQKLYPPKDELRAKYYVEWRMFKVDPVGSEEMNNMGAEEMVAAQKKLQEDMEQWVKDQAKEIHLALGKAAARAQALLSKQGKLHPKNIKPLVDAFEMFKVVDFTGSDLQKKIDELKKLFIDNDNLDMSAEAINDDQEQFKSMLETFADLAVDAVAEEAGDKALQNSEFNRLLEL
jgi:hypothetical protein